MSEYNFTYCPIDLGITEDDMRIMLEEINNVTDEKWPEPDEFRSLRDIVLYENNSFLDSCDIYNFQKIRDVCQKKILHMFPESPRIRIIRADAGIKLLDHCDCTIKKLETEPLRLGFRLILQGDIEKFYFLDELQRKKYVPSDYRSYIINMCHPHGCDASSRNRIIFSAAIVRENGMYKESSEYIKRLHVEKSLKLNMPPNIHTFSYEFNRNKSE